MNRHTKRGYRLTDLHKPWGAWHPLDWRFWRYWRILTEWADRMEHDKETRTGWFDLKYKEMYNNETS